MTEIKFICIHTKTISIFAHFLTGISALRAQSSQGPLLLSLSTSSLTLLLSLCSFFLVLLSLYIVRCIYAAILLWSITTTITSWLANTSLFVCIWMLHIYAHIKTERKRQLQKVNHGHRWFRGWSQTCSWISRWILAQVCLPLRPCSVAKFCCAMLSYDG